MRPLKERADKYLAHCTKNSDALAANDHAIPMVLFLNRNFSICESKVKLIQPALLFSKFVLQVV